MSDNSLKEGAPLNLDEPKPTDKLLSDQLMDVMNSSKEFESKEAIEHRQSVVKKLENLAKDFVQSVCIRKNVPESVLEHYSGKIHTFGAHRFGVFIKGHHIDALCLAPQIIERRDFFKDFCQILNRQTDVKDLTAAEDAYVPIIRLYFDGIEVFIMFARLAFYTIPNSFDIRDNELLRNLDIFCVRSMNWCRATEEILQLVPDVDNFRNCLRGILHWAINRGIHGNVWGFLSALPWAILVARICQLHPNENVATLIQRFFSLFSQWKWPNPIVIKPIERNDLNLPGWDATHAPSDKRHFMPIICPSYPHNNCASNVSRSSRDTMIKELQRGHDIVSDIYNKNESWCKLFEERAFFSEYKHFIEITASTEDEKHHKPWAGLVQSKIRILVEKLEWSNDIVGAHVKSKAFPSNERSSWVAKWFLGLNFVKRTRYVDLTTPTQIFTSAIYGQAKNQGLYHDDMKVTAEYKKAGELIKYRSCGDISTLRVVEEAQQTYVPTTVNNATISDNDASSSTSSELRYYNSHVEDKTSSDESAVTAFSSSKDSSTVIETPKRSSENIAEELSPPSKSRKVEE